MYRKRFGFTNHPFSKDAHGDTFFDASPGYVRLRASFKQLIDDPGLAVVTAEPGTGKTAALRNLCAQLPRPDYLVVYLCDTAVSPLDLYRALAIELGVRPSHRRAQLWRDIKNALVHMVDERHTMPVIIIDEAHHLSDKFLLDLSGFLNFAFDSRDLFTVWLAAHTSFAKRLKMQIHDALRSRSVVQVHLEPYDRETFAAFIEHGLRAVGATQKLLSDPALEQLFRTSRGLPRVAAKLSRAALRLAHERNQHFIDERTMDDALASIAAPTTT
jgi:type II secretory pathway predicted ATPase ExeA